MQSPTMNWQVPNLAVIVNSHQIKPPMGEFCRLTRFSPCVIVSACWWWMKVLSM